MVYNKENPINMEPVVEAESQTPEVSTPLEMTRREFLRLAGMVGTLAVLAGCQPQPGEEIKQLGEIAEALENLATPTPTEIPPSPAPTKEPTKTPEPTIPPRPTETPKPEPEPKATPTAPAVDVSVEIREKYKKENLEVEVVSPIAFGGAAMSSVWPEKMGKKVAEEFVHFRVNPQEPLKIEENTRVLVSLEEGIAGAVLMPWRPEEGEEETLAIFASLLPKKLNGGEIDYQITQEVKEITEEGTEIKEEALHLAVYRDTEGKVTHLLVPFVTPGTIGEEKWEEIGNKIKALKVAGSIEEEQIITAIEGEGEEEKPVMIVLGKKVDEKGGEVLEEFLRIGLKTIELTEEERERVKEQGLGSFARFKRNEGEYVLWREGTEGEIVEEIIKLWQVPEELKEKIPVEPEKPEGILELEGFTTVWDRENNRWVYEDIDGKAIAYWDQEANEGEGRIELVESVKELDFEKQRGLFTPWTPEQTEKAFIEGWEERKEIRQPIWFEIDKGKIIEVVSSTGNPGLCLREISPGTLFRAPFGGEVIKFGSEVNAGFDLVYKDFALHVVFKSWEDFLGLMGLVLAGASILRFSDKRLTGYGRNRYSKYQLRIAAADSNWDKAYPLTFRNLLRDEQGKIVYLKTS